MSSMGHTPLRHRLPLERSAHVHEFSIGGHEGHLIVGEFEDGSPGEVFIQMSKHGATLSGLMDGWATTLSLCLQYNVPLDVLVDKLAHLRFPPEGYTGFSEIPTASSILDYVVRYLALRYLTPEALPTPPKVMSDAL